MKNLIKSISDQLSILGNRKQDLIKTLPNGQWELLSKADEPVKGPPVPVASKFAASNKKFSELFGELNTQVKAAKTGGTSYVNGARGAIKSYALTLPKGQIDLGNLSKLRQGLDDHVREGARFGTKPFSHGDMADIVNHHVGDAPSLKHIHDNNGGSHAIEALARTMGANGDPVEYSAFKFKNPQVHADLLDLIHPGKPHTYEGEPLVSTYSETPADPAFDHEVYSAHQAVTADDDGSYGWDNQQLTRRLTTAAAKRAVHRFKKHHGIP